MVTVLGDPAFECYEDLGDLVNPTNKGETMNDLAILTMVAILFTALCWRANARTTSFVFEVVTWIGLVGGFGIASVGLIQMAARTL